MTMKKSIREIMDEVNHPPYYGGADNPYECAKVLEAWGLENDWYLATAIAYMCRAGKKDSESYARDIAKAKWFLDRKVKRMIELEENSMASGTVDDLTIPESIEEPTETPVSESPFAKDLNDTMKKRRW